MGYIIGISSGAFGLVETAEKASLMTIPRKIFYVRHRRMSGMWLYKLGR